MQHKKRSVATPEGWLFANPVTGKPYHQEEIQKRHIRKAGIAAEIGGDIGWHTFRHSYRSWLDETGAPLTVQKELMRHASIQTTINIYGKAMTPNIRLTGGLLNWFLSPAKRRKPLAKRSRSRLLGANGSSWHARKTA